MGRAHLRTMYVHVYMAGQTDHKQVLIVMSFRSRNELIVPGRGVDRMSISWEPLIGFPSPIVLILEMDL